MMGQRSICAFCFQARGLVFLERTMINDDSNVLPCSKRAFSDVREGMVLKTFSGDKPLDSVFLLLCFGSSYRRACVLQ